MKIFKIKEAGITYYTQLGGNIVNLTYDDVTEDNYDNVVDIDCYTTECMMTDQQFYNDVDDYIASVKLHSVIVNELSEKYGKDIAQKVCSKMDEQRAIRENVVMKRYTHFKEKGNMLGFYDDEGNGFNVDFRIGENTLGSLV